MFRRSLWTLRPSNSDSRGGEDNSQTLTVTSTRDWTIEQDENEKWVTFSPASGSASSEPQTVTVTVTDNNESDRTATIVFKAATVRKELTVTQKGPNGSVEDSYVYHNDFDKERATEPWPDLASFEGWHNETGSGIANVTYSYSGMQVRANGFSDNQYSLYKDQASGANNLFFQTSPYFSVENIALNADNRNYRLSFGVTKYNGDEADNHVTPEVFHVYLSNDGQKWVEIVDYAFASGSAPDGSWDLAYKVFSVPAETQSLYLYFKADVASGFRIDDLTLSVSSESGTEIDFSQGGEIEGSETVSGSIADVLAAEDDTPVSTQGTIMAFYDRGFILSDGTDNILVYGGEGYSIEASAGATVSVSGTRDTFNGVAQIGSPDVTVVSEGETPSYPQPKVLSGTAADDYLSSGVCEYIQYEGVLSAGSHYNVSIPGASTAIGSIAYPLSDLNITDFDGMTVTVTGYYIGTSSGKYISTLVPIGGIEVSDSDYFTVSTESLSLSAAANSTATFSINSNVEWTVTSDAEWLTVNPANGNGTAEVTATATENTASGPREATITVSTTADVATKSYEIAVTQAAPASGDAKYYVKVTSAPSDWSGQYLIVYEGEEGNLAFDGSLTTLDAVNDYKEVTISGNGIESNDEVNAISFTIESSGSGYNIKSASGYYIYQTSDANGLKSSTSVPEDINTITYDSTDGSKIECNGAVLRFNSTSNQMRFRYYKSSSYTNQKPISLYKLAE